MATSSPPIKASIVIRAFNEAAHIGKLLYELRRQVVDFKYEVILVDSGSTDDTVSIAQQYGVKLVGIDPEEFTFGRSLNRGIGAATGEFCVFISAHCYPADEQWLRNLLGPFQDEKTALVYGCQRGNQSTHFSENQIFQKWFPDTSIEDYQLPFCNNANAAIRRSVWEQYHYNEKLTGLEDLDWARFARDHGYRITYRADATIIHVHDETPRQIFRRYYREAYAYKEIYREQSFGFLDFLKFFCMNCAGDAIHALQDGGLFRNLFGIMQFRFLQFWATYKAHQFVIPISHDMAKRLYYPRRPALLRFTQRVKGPKQEKTTQIYDVTRPLSSGLPVWPGAKSFSLEWVKTFDRHQVNESHLSFNLHTGTHIDSPFHFTPDGDRLGQVGLEKMVGCALVLEYSKPGPIEVDFLDAAGIRSGVRRILLKTLNSLQVPSGAGFNKDFVAITPESARWLVERGIDLIGTDGPSIQGFSDQDNTTHEVLLKAGVVILEGLLLGEVPGGEYKLVALPLNIPEAEGAPVRAILIKGEIQ